MYKRLGPMPVRRSKYLLLLLSVISYFSRIIIVITRFSQQYCLDSFKNCLTNLAVRSLNASDHKARMRKIETEGNSPEEWKAYIDFLKTVPSEGDIRTRPLSEAYSRAFTVSELSNL